ncbi:MAG: F0F1 ATP synthase subunit delta [Verrucomicrobiales bacterium]|nr:F0F1 ATP synthase subunit delta [Verrucomicrobiales bacterium]
MKVSKEARRTSRKLLAACISDGKVDLQLVRTIVTKLTEGQYRGYLQVIHAFWRLVRLEVAKSQALVESAVELDSTMQNKVVADLQAKYGKQVEATFKVNPELIGGMRIKVGSDVWDGSVKNRIERLSGKFC